MVTSQGTRFANTHCPPDILALTIVFYFEELLALNGEVMAKNVLECLVKKKLFKADGQPDAATKKRSGF